MSSQFFNPDDAYVYQLVEFVSRKKQKFIDVVPTDWVSYDDSINKIVSKFMPPPYDAENNQLLHDLIQKRGPAPADWPTYYIKIRGQASEYIALYCKFITKLNQKSKLIKRTTITRMIYFVSLLHFNNFFLIKLPCTNLKINILNKHLS